MALMVIGRPWSVPNSGDVSVQRHTVGYGLHGAAFEWKAINVEAIRRKCI